MLSDPDYEPRKQTANSRLFSNMELSLVMHLYGAISRSNCPWLVIGYEADGILVAAIGDKQKVNQDLLIVNNCFKESILGLTSGNHALEIKNFV